MSGSQGPADGILQICRVQGSNVTRDPKTGKAEGITYDVVGLEGPGVGAERDPRGEAFGSVGVCVRPLPEYVPTEVGQLAKAWKDGERNSHAEAVCVRTSDGLMPVAHRDDRIKMGGEGPHPGTVALCGYGGSHLAFTPEMQGGVPLHDHVTLYCPHGRGEDGRPTAAHAVIMDGTEGRESVSLIHSSGLSITMFDGSMVLKNRHGNAFIELNDNGIVLRGQVQIDSLVVGNPSTASALLPGSASQGSSVLFVSP